MLDTIRKHAYGDLAMVMVVGAMSAYLASVSYSISHGQGSTDPIPNPLSNVILPAVAATALVWIAVTAYRLWGSEEKQ